MPKRKRETEETVPSTSSKFSAQKQRVRRELDYATSKLTHAFKIAKGPERQKLGRRQKKAQSHEQSRIAAEIDALKALDISLSVQHFLFKSLNKVKAISASNILSNTLQISSPLPSDSATQNVHGRLCGSALVKDAFSGVIQKVLRAADLESLKRDQKVGSKKDAGKTIDAEMDILDDDFEGERESIESGDGGDDFEDFDDSEDEYDKFAHRLASSGEDSDEDDVDGSEGALDEDELERQLEMEGVKRRLSISDEGPSGDDDAAIVTRKTKPAAKSRLPTSSTLLPSLTMGGYISASDGSEVEEVEVAPRKNKRGQRARQLIWEKKYGSKAKHLKHAKPSRDIDWDPKRGAVAGRSTGFRKNPTGDMRGSSSAMAKPAAKKAHKDDEGPIHPSWEAAKRAKEKTTALPAFSGKKITFD